ncbi:MAG: TIGR02996 domain-containing protein, partial [Gemmataceae bacterium]
MDQPPPAPDDPLAAVRADPDGDGPRLAFADRLEAGGQKDRAEYVRLAVLLERLGTSLRPGHEAARRRTADLSRAHHKEWQAERPALEGVRWGLHRGLLEHVWFDSYTAFHRQAAAALGHFVTRVGLSNLRAPRKFFDSPALARVRGLDLRSCAGFDAQGVGLLAASPHVAGLTWLALPGNVCGPAELEALAGSPHLANLRTLTLGGYYSQNHNTPDGFIALAAS